MCASENNDLLSQSQKTLKPTCGFSGIFWLHKLCARPKSSKYTTTNLCYDFGQYVPLFHYFENEI